MKKSIGTIIAIMMTVIMATSVSAPASAFSVFGVNFGSSSSSTSTTSSTAVDTQPCLRTQNHEYEVCTAYIANASTAVLVPYYAYANSSNSAWVRYVTYRLSSRYTGDAYNLLRNRVASWPSGNHEVSVPNIEVLSVNSNLSTNTATLTTRESWRVTTESGNTIYQEANTLHTITMQRVPSYVLHKWVVTGIR
jgi:hypothetical protein